MVAKNAENRKSTRVMAGSEEGGELIQYEEKWRKRKQTIADFSNLIDHVANRSFHSSVACCHHLPNVEPAMYCWMLSKDISFANLMSEWHIRRRVRRCSVDLTSILIRANDSDGRNLRFQKA